MSALSSPQLAYLSANTRRERARIRNAVQAGVSLAVLIGEDRVELRYVEVRQLVRWLPGVGTTRARSLLMGIPERAYLSELVLADRETLVRRIRDRERAQLIPLNEGARHG